MDNKTSSIRRRRLREDINKGMDNVIPFPKTKRVNTPPQSDEEMRAQVLRNKKKYVNNLVEHYTNQLAMKFVQHGFSVDDEEFLRDFSFSVESIRSSLYRSLGIGHPFQDIMDDTIEMLEGLDQEEAQEESVDEDPDII